MHNNQHYIFIVYLVVFVCLGIHHLFGKSRKKENIPEVGIHHELWPQEIAEKLWLFLESMVAFMIHNKMDYVFEGEASLPENLCQLMAKYPSEIRDCFLGYKDMDIPEKIIAVMENPSHGTDVPYIEMNSDFEVLSMEMLNKVDNELKIMSMIHYGTDEN